MRKVLCSIALLATVSVLGLGGVANATEPNPPPGDPTSVPFDPGVAPQIVGGSSQTITNYPWMAALLVKDRSEVQHIVVNATGGAFTVTWNGQTTAPLAFNISGAAFTTAMENLSNVAPGDVVVTGGPGDAGGNTPYVLTWAITLGDVAQPTTNATNLTGGAGSATPSTVTSGLNDPFQEQFCGGSLIDARYILTAAHCITNFDLDPGPGDLDIDASQIDVVMGKTDLDTITPPDRRTITTITKAPGYDVNTHEHDLAILTLSTPAIGIPTVAYANDESSETLNKQAVIIGWGATDFGPNGFSSVLQGGVVKVLAPPPPVSGNGTCGTIPGPPAGPNQVFFPESHICAGQSQTGGTPDNCVFDDGGPLVVGNLGGWKLIGVTTDLGPCGEDDPSLYARVSADSGWIDGFVGLPSSQGTYHPIVPFRLTDTRDNTGALGSGIVGPQWTINPQVTGFGSGPNQVPLSGANAVVLNVTATGPTAAGWLTLFPTGAPLPTASNLNFTPGLTVPNLVTVQLGQAGKVSVNNTGGNAFAGNVHVVIDVVGWYGTDDSGAFFNSVAPVRLVDTRLGTTANPGLDDPVALNSPITPNVCSSSTGIPITASAVVINVTAVGGSTSGWVTVWPDGSAPVVSNLNFGAGQSIANLVQVKVSTITPCTIKVGNSPGKASGSPINVIIDIVGYYEQPGDATGARFHAMTPERFLDTRSGTGTPNPGLNTKMTAGGSIAPLVANVGSVPDAAVAVIVNLTATAPTSTGWLTAYPTGTVPTASNLNFLAGQTVPNLAIVGVHTDNRIRIDNTNTPSGPPGFAGQTHVVMDVTGWFE